MNVYTLKKAGKNVQFIVTDYDTNARICYFVDSANFEAIAVNNVFNFTLFGIFTFKTNNITQNPFTLYADNGVGTSAITDLATFNFWYENEFFV